MSLRPTILSRYLLKRFWSVFFLCLLASTVLFLVFDFFERMRLFLKEDTPISVAFTYLTLKIPLVVQLMTPIAVLVAVVVSVGRLSQLSEVTAMRSCGASVIRLARPLIGAGVVISLVSLLLGETIVPFATRRVEEIYHLDIKKKAERGVYSRANFWHRSHDKFYNVGLFDSRNSTLSNFSLFEFDSGFNLKRRLDAREIGWLGNDFGWSMRDVTEYTFNSKGHIARTPFRELPLVISERPKDFRDARIAPESMGYRELTKYITKLRSEGVPVARYLVERAAKISFPFVSLILVLVAFPLSLIPSRSGNLTASILSAVSIAFGYYFVHAFCTSLGAAELIPIYPAAWAANILLICIGGYLLAGAEER